MDVETSTGSVNQIQQQQMLEEPLLSQSESVRAAECQEQVITTAEALQGNDDNNTNNYNDSQSSTPSTSPNSISRNIPIMFAYNSIRCGGEAVWLGSVLSAYVYLLKPKNPEMIGYLSALEGIVQFIAACGAGILGDSIHIRRDTLLKFSCMIGVIASVLIVASCLNTELFVCLVIALALNGAFDGIAITASLALFADSIKDGHRSYYFTKRTLYTTGGQFAGPVMGLISFYALGDQWTIQACAKVIGGAQLLLLPAFILLCFFRDENVDEPSSNNENADVPLAVDGEDAQDANETDENGVEDGEEGESNPLLLSNTDNNNEDEMLQPQQSIERSFNLFATITNKIMKQRIIATCTATSDILCAIGSGISLRYFTIFFVDNLQFVP